MKLAIIVGTRPEIIRLSRTINLCRQLFDTTLIHTGQNYDYNLNDVFFKDLDIDNPDIFLECSRTNCCSAVGDIITKTYTIFKDNNFDAILILGDTNSALCAYSAKRLKIPIFHLEAGNRSFDPNVPEEINRKIIDHLSDVNMCYMEHARRNLLKENCRNEYTFVVGSPMTEVIEYLSSSDENSILNKLNIQKNNYIVWSSHREDNIDNEENFFKMIESLNKICDIYKKKIVFGAHPRARNKILNNNVELHKDVIFVEPFGIKDYYKLLKNSYFVVSDSGTISEEASILDFKAVLLRYSTEHPECIDAGNIILGNIDWENLSNSINVLLNTTYNKNTIVDYKDDNFSKKVVSIIAGYTSIVNKMLWMK